MAFGDLPVKKYEEGGSVGADYAGMDAMAGGQNLAEGGVPDYGGFNAEADAAAMEAAAVDVANAYANSGDMSGTTSGLSNRQGPTTGYSITRGDLIGTAVGAVLPGLGGLIAGKGAQYGLNATDWGGTPVMSSGGSPLSANSFGDGASESNGGEAGGRDTGGGGETQDFIPTAPSTRGSDTAAAIAEALGYNGRKYLPYTGDVFKYGEQDKEHRFFSNDTPAKTGYASGGHIVGPGHGTSDSIPAVIDGQQPAAISTGEYIVPAKAVTKLGQGNNQIGAKVLDRIVEMVKQEEEMGQPEPLQSGLASLLNQRVP